MHFFLFLLPNFWLYAKHLSYIHNYCATCCEHIKLSMFTYFTHFLYLYMLGGTSFNLMITLKRECDRRNNISIFFICVLWKTIYRAWNIFTPNIGRILGNSFHPIIYYNIIKGRTKYSHSWRTKIYYSFLIEISDEC